MTMIIQLSCGRQRQRRTRPELDLKPGDKVLRRSDKDVRLAVGVVEAVWNGRARVRWPAPRRIGGEFHHSTVKLNSPDLMLATDEAIAERLVDVRLAGLRYEMDHALRFCRIEQPADMDWFMRNRTTPDEYFEKLCARIREKSRLLIAAGRERARLRAAA